MPADSAGAAWTCPSRAFVRISKRARLQQIVRPYMLRHTWAVLMLNRAVPIRYVSRALGHDSLAHTTWLYIEEFAEPEFLIHQGMRRPPKSSAPGPGA